MNTALLAHSVNSAINAILESDVIIMKASKWVGNKLRAYLRLESPRRSERLAKKTNRLARPSSTTGIRRVTFVKDLVMQVFTAQVIKLFIEENVVIDQATINRIQSLVSARINVYFWSFVYHRSSNYLQEVITNAP